MENCKRCLFYDPKYDKMRQSGDDIIIEGQKSEQKNYCRMYDKHVDPDIINDKKICEFFTDM